MNKKRTRKKKFTNTPEVSGFVPTQEEFLDQIKHGISIPGRNGPLRMFLSGDAPEWLERIFLELAESHIHG